MKFRGFIKLLVVFIVLSSSIGFFNATEKSKAAGATLFLSPAKGEFVEDSTFDVSVMVNTGEYSVNAVEIELSFQPDRLQVVGSVDSSSLVSIWVDQPSYSNTDGTILLKGGLPTPGITTTSGSILALKFRAKKSGDAIIKFGDNSKVLANDGEGSNILSGKNNSTYKITSKAPDGPVISSETHPDQNDWYKNNFPIFTWEGINVDAISWDYNQNPASHPDDTPEELNHTIATTADSDGIWYLHLKVMSNNVWGPTTNYLTHIDSEHPSKFSIKIKPSRVTIDTRPVATFHTTDATSGMDHYEIKVESKDDNSQQSSFFTEQISPYILPPLAPGSYNISVLAFDKAGNSIESAKSFEVLDPVVGFLFEGGTKYFLFSLLTLIIILLILVAKRKIVIRFARKKKTTGK